MTQKYKKFLIKTTKTITKLIHSHNTMKVFFSGTDMAELDDNSPSHNFYLSLIVNNAMDFVAKVAFVASAEVKGEVNYIALDENGNEYNIERTTLKAKKDKLFIYDCEIETNLDKREPDNFFQRNLKEVLAEVNKPVVNRGYPSPGTYKTGTGYSAPVIPNTPTYNPYPPTYNPYTSSYPTYNNEENLLEDDIDVSPDIEIFTMQLLNGTNEPEEGTTFEDLILQLKMFKVSGEYIAKSVLDNFFTLFEKYYEDYTADEGVFLEVVEEVTEFLELYEFKHNILTPTILTLKKMVKEYLNMEKQ